MTIRLGTSLSLRCTEALECPVCRQYITRERVGDACAMVALVGCAPYAQCPSCKQEVADHEERYYRRRARRWVAARDGGQLLVILAGTDSPALLARCYAQAQAELAGFPLLLIDRDKAPEQAADLRLYGTRFYLLTAAPPETWAEELAFTCSANLVRAHGLTHAVKNNSEKVGEGD